jgi:2-hydroxychromene-2-carboxylate isomerase
MTRPVPVEVYFNFRSPYCYLALKRLLLADAYGPGVTRGHPRLHGWYEQERNRGLVRQDVPDRLPMAGRDMGMQS